MAEFIKIFVQCWIFSICRPEPPALGPGGLTCMEYQQTRLAMAPFLTEASLLMAPVRQPSPIPTALAGSDDHSLPLSLLDRGGNSFCCY